MAGQQEWGSGCAGLELVEGLSDERGEEEP